MCTEVCYSAVEVCIELLVNLNLNCLCNANPVFAIKETVFAKEICVSNYNTVGDCTVVTLVKSKKLSIYIVSTVN